jgi:acetyl-CoA carboxylase biotin carboxylase subunit
VFESVLVANRGEIACRIQRTLRELGVRSIAVYSEADAGSRHVREADEAVAIGASPAAQSYLSAEAVLRAAVQCRAEAVHPGYGFLSENAEFARAVLATGLAWVGPSPECIEAMGDKINARNRMAAAGVPVAAGTASPVVDAEAAVAAARVLGYPVMVKAAAGGGGIGMAVALGEDDLRAAFATARSRAERSFGDARILLEHYLPHARHVEVQILGLDSGVVALGERDCSVQRRHQKVAEETPSPGVGPHLRAQMLAAAVHAGEAVDYRGAGTVECLVDPGSGEFVFLEMNTRLQVEHPVTEMVTGLDLVAEQLRLAAGEPPGFDPAAPPAPRGHALELRIYAEDPVRFLPGPGTITTWEEPSGPGVRVDAGYGPGDVVTPFYDPLLAKLCVWGPDRPAALERAREALRTFTVAGPRCNLAFFPELLAQPEFVSGEYDTTLVARMRP